MAEGFVSASEATRSIHRATLLTEGRLAVVANGGAVYAFDVETLEQRWKAGRTQ